MKTQLSVPQVAAALENASWAAGKSLAADIREIASDETSDRDLLSGPVSRSLAEAACALSLLTRYSHDCSEAVAEVVTMRLAPDDLTPEALANTLYWTSLAHAGSLLDLALSPADLAPEALSRDFAAVLEDVTAALAEDREPGRARLEVAAAARRWEESGRFASMFVDPDRVAELAERDGYGTLDAPACEELAARAADSIAYIDIAHDVVDEAIDYQLGEYSSRPGER